MLERVRHAPSAAAARWTPVNDGSGPCQEKVIKKRGILCVKRKAIITSCTQTSNEGGLASRCSYTLD